MPAAGVVMIVAVVAIVAVVVYYLMMIIVALMRISKGLDEAIDGVVGIIDKTAPAGEVVTTINQNLDAGVDNLPAYAVAGDGRYIVCRHGGILRESRRLSIARARDAVYAAAVRPRPRPMCASAETAASRADFAEASESMAPSPTQSPARNTPAASCNATGAMPPERSARGKS